MTRYRTLLIDDEPLALQRLRRLLEPHSDVIEIQDTACHGIEAVTKINRLKPDLIFLDIQMPELDGFQVLERLHTFPYIIFCTAYDDYALRAFETNAIDYLLKPVEPERLAKAIDKLQRLTGDDRKTFETQLQHLMAHLKKPKSRRIQVRIGDRIRLLNPKDICFFKASDKYVEGHTTDQSYLLNQTLNQLETELAEYDFVRIHRSALINLNHLEEMFRWFGGSFRVRMKDKARTELPLSRAARQKLGWS